MSSDIFISSVNSGKIENVSGKYSKKGKFKLLVILLGVLVITFAAIAV